MSLRIRSQGPACGLTLAWLLLAAAPAVAEPLYSITDFGSRRLTSINNAGQVTVVEDDQSYLYNSFGADAGRLTSLGVIDGHPTGEGFVPWPAAVNDAGQVVGGAPARVPEGWSHIHAFLSQGGTMTDLGTPPGTHTSSATGINNSGQVVGYAYSLDGRARSFLYDGGTMTDLGTFGHAVSYAQDINAQGTVVGLAYDHPDYRGFIASRGDVTELGTFGGLSSAAYAVNDAGQVAGHASLPDGHTHAFLYKGGVMSDLGTLGGRTSWATGLNNLGQVVGISATASGEWTPFLYFDGEMIDLDHMIPESSGWNPGWHLGEGYGDPKINDAGQIIVAASHDGVRDSSLLLTPTVLPTPTPPPAPVPEPSTLGLFGLIAIAWAVRRGGRRAQPRKCHSM